MKYIKKVILENFQSHKYTEMEFDQYLNVIVGPSDQGKSAIIRGLKWALFNEPSGDFFIREGEKECSVTVVFNDNTKIKRFRSKSKNSYYLYNKDGEEMIFEGFGTTVPQEIIDKTSMRKVVLDGNQSNAINIGEQLEGPFLLSEKNATRANAIGRLVGVHIVDDALKDTLRDVRNLNIKKKSNEATLEKLQEGLLEYDYLDDLINRINQLRDVRTKIHSSQERLKKLNEILERLKSVNEEIKLSYHYLEKLKNVQRVIEIEKNLSQNIYNYESVNDKYNKLNLINNQIEKDKKLLNSLADIDKIKSPVENINILISKTKNLKKLLLSHKLLTENILKTKTQLNKLYNIEKMEENLSLINKKYLRYRELLNLEIKLNNINKNLSIGTVYTNKLSNINKAFHIGNTIESKNERLNKVVNYKNKYDTLLESCIREKSTIKGLEIELNNYLQKYEAILTKIEICPLCFSNIDKLKVNKIINNYK